MIQALTLKEFQTLSKHANHIAVFEEIPAGELTPVMIYDILNKNCKINGLILEDLQQPDSPCYSFLCFDPITSLMINYDDKGKHPLRAIRQLYTQLAISTRRDVADQITCAAGFMSYHAIRFFEDIPNRHTAISSTPDLRFDFYKLNFTFNHLTKSILISYITETKGDSELLYQHAKQEISAIIKLLHTSSGATMRPCKKQPPSTVKVDTTDLDFMNMVEKAKDYIHRGDAFQIVLSRCFMREYSVHPFEIYMKLRQVSPSPFMFYIPTETSVIIGASPERLVSVHNRQVSVNPIAGTRPRISGKTDAATTTDLLTDTKEIAEHMMLVDLARNDVGSVSLPGSVEVSELLHVKHYSHVSHITSTVIGQLQEPHDALDALAATFPAGTLSGAPKIRAMQIIDELETSSRGIYGGAIFRLDSLGNLDSCIAIRMAVLKDGVATIRTGAGIVHDSNPESEAQETQHKASSLLDAIAQAHGE